MYRIVVQQATHRKLAPPPSLLRLWAKQALTTQISNAQITIRLVDKKEMALLNKSYRNKEGPTNVLSFPLNLPKEIDMKMPILGDIIICSEVVNEEARLQKKTQQAHFAHMIVHGIFHLLGYDHETEKEAIVMESLEIKVMQTLGFPNPYYTGSID